MLLTFLKRFFTSLYLGHLLYSMVGHYIAPIPRSWIVPTLTLTNTLLALISFILLLFLTIAVILGARGVVFLINVRLMMLRFVGMGGPANDNVDEEVFDMIGEGQGESDNEQVDDIAEDEKLVLTDEDSDISDTDSVGLVDMGRYPLDHIFELDTEAEESSQPHRASQ